MEQLNILRKYNVPLASPSAAIQFLNKTRMTDDEYRERLEELLGGAETVLTERQQEQGLSGIRFLYLYLVQQIIEDSETTDRLDMMKTAEQAFDRADRFMANNQWVFAERKVVEKLDADGKVKPKKGAKKELARKVYDAQIRDKNLTRQEAIAILMSEVGLTKGGASTYYANLKKGVY